MPCDKMPELVVMGNYNNDWNKYLDALYIIYLEDFCNSPFLHKGLPLKTFTQLEYNMKQESFNHVTTKGDNNRLYNEERCKKLRWIKPILAGDCAECPTFRCFPDLDWNKKWKRFIVWCVGFDFIVIVEQRKDCFFLITAYCLIYKDKKEQLEKKYQKYLKTKSA